MNMYFFYFERKSIFKGDYCSDKYHYLQGFYNYYAWNWNINID